MDRTLLLLYKHIFCLCFMKKLFLVFFFFFSELTQSRMKVRLDEKYLFGNISQLTVIQNKKTEHTPAFPPTLKNKAGSKRLCVQIEMGLREEEEEEEVMLKR